MNIRQLETFVSVANYLSFTKAADELYITQSSVSKIIKSLEDELDAHLFYRSPDIQLTDAGAELYKHSVDILAQIENIPAEIGNVADLNKGKVRIGIPPIIGSSFFPAIIGKFTQRYPGIDINLVEVGSKVIQDELDKGNLDVGIICSYPDNMEAYEVHKFLQSQLLIGVPAEHPLARAKEISFKSLKDESFVLFNRDFSLYDSIIDLCNQNGFSPKIICNSSQKDFILKMVEAKTGITCLPEITCIDVKEPGITFVPMKNPKIFLNLMIVWKKNRYLPYACKEWIRLTAEELEINVDLE